MDDNVSLILLRHLVALGATEGATADLSNLETRAAAADAFKGRDWLLAYEAAAQSWVSNITARDDAFFAALLDAGVHFFDTPAPRPRAAHPGEIRRAPNGHTERTCTRKLGMIESSQRLDANPGDDSAESVRPRKSLIKRGAA